jgi:hypothetical protein
MSTSVRAVSLASIWREASAKAATTAAELAEELGLMCALVARHP